MQTTSVFKPDVVVSPTTGRIVSVGSSVYRKLIKEGHLQVDPLAESCGLIKEVDKDALNNQLGCYGKYAARGRGVLKGHYVARSLAAKNRRQSKKITIEKNSVQPVPVAAPLSNPPVNCGTCESRYPPPNELMDIELPSGWQRQ